MSDRERIGGGYSRGQRIGETVCVVFFFLSALATAWSIGRGMGSVLGASTVVLGLVAGALWSDLVSGTVHWACDTWGTIETPVLGRLFIRQFREHHSDEHEICRHDFVETNGTNAGLALIPIAGAWALGFDYETMTYSGLFARTALLSLAVFTTITSQAHKWAHSTSVSRPVAWMQRAGLVLSPKHHRVHHVWPHRHHYSITGGWMDRWLERWKVFRHAEALITRLSGVDVHTDDPPVVSPKRAA